MVVVVPHHSVKAALEWVGCKSCQVHNLYRTKVKDFGVETEFLGSSLLVFGGWDIS